MTSASACLSFQSLLVIQSSSRGMPAADELLQNEADAVFVAVDAGAIEVAVAHGGGAFDGLGDFVRRDMVAAEGAQPDGGHAGAGVKSSLGDERRGLLPVAGNGVHEDETKFHGTAEMRETIRLYRLLRTARGRPASCPDQGEVY